MTAEKRLKYGKVLGRLNPPDLFIKYLDQSTIEQHVAKLNYAFTDGRASEAPKLDNVSISIDEYNLMGQWGEWEWLDVINNSTQNHKCGDPKQKEKKMCLGIINLCYPNDSSMQRRTMIRNSNQIGLGHQVLRGFQRRVEGSSGTSMPTGRSAQLCRPRGSTQTLPSRHDGAQRLRRDGNAVVKAWGISHISGVVSREDRIQLLSEKGNARKKRMNRRLTNSGRYRGSAGERDTLLGSFEDKVNGSAKEEVGIHCATSPCYTQSADEIGHTTITTTADKGYNYSYPPARRQPEEFYWSLRHTNLVNPDSKLGPRRRCLKNYAIACGVPSDHGAIRCRRETASLRWQTRIGDEWAHRK